LISDAGSFWNIAFEILEEAQHPVWQILCDKLYTWRPSRVLMNALESSSKKFKTTGTVSVTALEMLPWIRKNNKRNRYGRK
jgi:hypothetical protein